MTGQDAGDILQQFRDVQNMNGVDEAYLEKLLRGVSRHAGDLDRELQPFLDRPVEQTDFMERVVLRIGAYELLHCPDLPFKVVIGECVDLANRFGSQQGHAYVNAVLDRAARAWRPEETGAAASS
jgi:N utilization substance protein B